MKRENYAWFNPLGAEKPWQGGYFLGALGMRYFLLMRYASAENRDWGEGCIESRSSSSSSRILISRMRYFMSMLYASAEIRDWGEGCIGP